MTAEYKALEGPYKDYFMAERQVMDNLPYRCSAGLVLDLLNASGISYKAYLAESDPQTRTELTQQLGDEKQEHCEIISEAEVLATIKLPDDIDTVLMLVDPFVLDERLWRAVRLALYNYIKAGIEIIVQVFTFDADNNVRQWQNAPYALGSPCAYISRQPFHLAVYATKGFKKDVLKCCDVFGWETRVSYMNVRPLVIDRAPGKELIGAIWEQADAKAFADFYRKRRDWRGYPLIHDGLITYGLFDDLIANLDMKTRAALLPTALTLAEEETDKLFLCAVYLILNLLDGFMAVDNQDDIRSRIRAMHPRAGKLSLFSNMSCFWNQIVNKVFPADKDGSMLVDIDDWRRFTPLNFPTVDDSGWQSCPGGEDAVKKEVKNISGDKFVLEYKRSALYNDSKYWIWLYRNVSEDPIYHFYIYIVTTAEGKTELFSHAMHSDVNISPEELVVMHAYGLAD